MMRNWWNVGIEWTQAISRRWWKRMRLRHSAYTKWKAKQSWLGWDSGTGTAWGEVKVLMLNILEAPGVSREDNESHSRHGTHLHAQEGSHARSCLQAAIKDPTQPGFCFFFSFMYLPPYQGCENPASVCQECLLFLLPFHLISASSFVGLNVTFQGVIPGSPKPSPTPGRDQLPLQYML